jgi:citrate lyase subunit beta / citryl-CoA lyase
MTVLRRSALFVPAGVERFYARASASGADVVVLDLEDAVPRDGKVQARAQIAAARRAISPPWCAVRVNSDAGLIADDIEACAAASADEVVLPKVGSARDIATARRLIARHGGWRPALSILVETLDAVRRLPSLLADAGLIASVALGMEDLSAELVLSAPGRNSAGDLGWLHAQLLLWAGTATGIPIGILGELGNFTDMDAFRDAAVAAWRSGYRGTYCIHPAQVPVANAAYAPDQQDVQWAAEVIGSAAEAGRLGRGSATVNGRMVDAPSVRRAQRIMDYDEAARRGPGR